MELERKISLCMIAKNEAEWIGQAIRSVLPILHEIIVVDTGSTDDTVTIVKDLNGIVINEPWEDDFAKHRNTSLQSATGDWILVLDADEQIAAQDLESLYQLTADDNICTEFLQRHYTDDHRLSDFIPCKGEFPQFEKQYAGYFESNCTRLFPNHAGLYFQGRVHELVEHSIHKLKKHRIERTPIRIHHYGHTKEVLSKKNKTSIYAPLGKQKTHEEGNNWKAFYELGVEYNVHDKKKESIDAFDKALTLNPHYADSWLNRGYVHMELGNYKEALDDFEQVLKLEPNNPESWCNIGVVGMRIKDFKLAEQACLSALTLRPEYINVLLNLARIYIFTSRFSEAAVVLKQVLFIVPKSSAAYADLGALYLRVQLFDEAEKCLTQALAYDAQNENARINLQTLQQMKNT